jgi:WD40 repeat protein
VFPSEVKLKPKTLNSTQGGSLTFAVRVGPLPAVTSLAFRGDNRLLAVGTYGQVVLWDLQDGRPARAIETIPGPVHALAFSRDGRRLAVGAGLPARSGVVRIYSVPDGTMLHDFPGHQDVVFGLAIRPDGAQLASTSFDQTVRFWDPGSGRASGVFSGHSDFVYAASYTPDGRGLVTAGKDRMIKWINTRTFKEERTYSGHDDDVLSLAVHPDGTKFVSAGNEPRLLWWTFGTDKPATRHGGHSAPVQQLAFSGDGRRLISTGGDRSVRLWDGKSGQPQRQLAGATDWQYAAAISDDGKLAAAGGWDGLVRLWDADSGKLRVTLVQPPIIVDRPSLSPEPQARPVDWLAVSPTGHVAGSAELIRIAHWRASGITLPDVDVRNACVQPAIVAQAIRGEPVSPVSFPSNPGK